VQFSVQTGDAVLKPALAPQGHRRATHLMAMGQFSGRHATGLTKKDFRSPHDAVWQRM
jgi:hypothetical protein